MELGAGLPEDTNVFDVPSDASCVDIVWRYVLSKMMVHSFSPELGTCIDEGAGLEHSRVILNSINPRWCGTELSRVKPSNVGDKTCFALIRWTAEKDGQVCIYALAAGKESHGSTCLTASTSLSRNTQVVREAVGSRGICGESW